MKQKVLINIDTVLSVLLTWHQNAITHINQTVVFLSLIIIPIFSQETLITKTIFFMQACLESSKLSCYYFFFVNLKFTVDKKHHD